MPLDEPVRSPSWPRWAVIAAFALGAAGCSADNGRFDGVFSNPFSSRSSQPAQSDVAGSVQAPPGPSHVEARPLPPQQSQYQPAPHQSAPLPPPPQAPRISAPQTRPAAAYTQGDVTGSVAGRPQAQDQGNWDWNGGTAVTLAPGETVDIIAHRYGVPSSAIRQANGLAPGAPAQPGQRLVIPKYNQANVTNPPAMRGPLPPQTHAPYTTASVRQTAPSQSIVHTVNPGETLMSLSRKYNKTIGEIARANNMSVQHRLRLGERVTIPGYRATPAIAAARPIPSAPATQSATLAPQRMVAAEPQNTARVVTPAKENPAEEPAAAEPTGGTGFRWPVRGRVIAGFGPKPTGQQNDGINLAVPEGTPIKAADDGVVAYAGNELKGYGNLVLVRHSSGYVTAYAHASELMVKRGEQVKRGQIIAKSGQTGNVTSPQLHFEIRKGATPVDPMQHLSGAT